MQDLSLAGHFVGDPGTYRPKEEVAAWREKDPSRATSATSKSVECWTGERLKVFIRW